AAGGATVRGALPVAPAPSRRAARRARIAAWVARTDSSTSPGAASRWRRKIASLMASSSSPATSPGSRPSVSWSGRPSSRPTSTRSQAARWSRWSLTAQPAGSRIVASSAGVSSRTVRSSVAQASSTRASTVSTVSGSLMIAPPRPLRPRSAESVKPRPRPARRRRVRSSLAGPARGRRPTIRRDRWSTRTATRTRTASRCSPAWRRSRPRSSPSSAAPPWPASSCGASPGGGAPRVPRADPPAGVGRRRARVGPRRVRGGRDPAAPAPGRPRGLAPRRRLVSSRAMNAVIATRWAEPAELAYTSVPDPVPGPGEVLVETRAIGCNFFDILIVQGKYQIRPPLPFSPGGEVAGVVRAVGPGVTRTRPGQRVIAMADWGGYAELVAAPEHRVFPTPEGMSDVEAAAFFIVYQTSYSALVHRAALRPGEWLLVHAAAGGVGLAAVQ